MGLGSLGGLLNPGIALGTGGALLDAKINRDNMKDQMRAQEEMSKHGVAWRVADAKRAGVHPLYALGANVASYSPVPQASSALGPAMESMGQNLSRPVMATMTPEQKEVHLETMAGHRARRAVDEAQAALLWSQVSRSMQDQNNGIMIPEVGIPTKDASSPRFEDLVKPEPDKRTSVSSADPSRTAGNNHPLFRQYRGLHPDLPIYGLASEEGPAESFEGVGAMTLGALKTLSEWASTLHSNNMYHFGRFKKWLGSKLVPESESRTYRAWRGMHGRSMMPAARVPSPRNMFTRGDY